MYATFDHKTNTKKNKLASYSESSNIESSENEAFDTVEHFTADFKMETHKGWIHYNSINLLVYNPNYQGLNYRFMQSNKPSTLDQVQVGKLMPLQYLNNGKFCAHWTIWLPHFGYDKGSKFEIQTLNHTGNNKLVRREPSYAKVPVLPIDDTEIRIIVPKHILYTYGKTQDGKTKADGKVVTMDKNKPIFFISPIKRLIQGTGFEVEPTTNNPYWPIKIYHHASTANTGSADKGKFKRFAKGELQKTGGNIGDAITEADDNQFVYYDFKINDIENKAFKKRIKDGKYKLNKTVGITMHYVGFSGDGEGKPKDPGTDKKNNTTYMKTAPYKQSYYDKNIEKIKNRQDVGDKDDRNKERTTQTVVFMEKHWNYPLKKDCTIM